MNTLIHNRFDIVVRDASTEKIIEKHTGYNIILNTFWAQFLRSDNRTTLSYLQYGSGTSAPIATDTALGSHINGKAVTNIAVDTSTFAVDRTIKRTSQIRIEASESNGTTISEVGMATGASSGLVTKALIKDQNGNPIQIAKTDTVVVDIYSTFFIVLPTSVTMGGKQITYSPDLINWLTCASTYLRLNCTFRNTRQGGTSYNPITENTNNSFRFVSTAAATYNTAQRKLELAVANIPSGSANIGGIAEMGIAGAFVDVPNSSVNSPKIIKEVIGTGDGATKDFKSNFSRIVNNGEAKAYINDVETAATIDYGTPGKAESYLPYFKDTGLTYSQASTTRPIYENLLYDKGIYPSSFSAQRASLLGANDLSGPWTLIGEAAGTLGTITVSANYKYFTSYYIATTGWSMTPSDGIFLSFKEVHFSSAPASGATVALTYNTDCIPKDSSSVFNGISMSLTFAEYTP